MNKEDRFSKVVGQVVASDILHARWLNTLSYLENCGARKIARFEDPVGTNIIILKHAAEEARHAYYLKKQITKLGIDLCPDYSKEYMLSAGTSYYYLHKLDIETCRFLKMEKGFTGRRIKLGAYLLVTYAIEVRADSLYGIYQKALTETGSKVMVKSIIAEEEGHLEEMTKMLKEEFGTSWEDLASVICKKEDVLFGEWIETVWQDINAGQQAAVH